MGCLGKDDKAWTVEGRFFKEKSPSNHFDYIGSNNCSIAVTPITIFSLILNIGTIKSAKYNKWQFKWKF